MNRYAAAIVCLALTLGVAALAPADLIVYTDRATFDAVVTGQSIMTFDGLAPSGGYAGIASPYSESGITLTNNYGFYALNDAPWGQGFTGGKQVINVGSDGSAVATLPAGKTAVGGDVYRLVEPDGQGGWKYDESRYVGLTVHFSDNSSQGFTLDFGTNDQNTSLFAGVVVTTPGVTISSVSFAASDGPNGYKEAVIDNLTCGIAVPEPGAMSLLTVGLIGLLAYAWRKRT